MPHSDSNQSDARAIGGMVLIIDDEEVVRRLVERILRRAGLDVMSAGDGAGAIEMFRANHEQISAVLLDVSMPGLDGREVFQALVEIDPQARVILSSGYSEQDVLGGFGQAAHVAGFLQKPYQSNELLDAVMNAPAPGG